VSTRNRLASRSIVIEAATRHIALRGAHGCSTRAIAQDAGLSQAYVVRLFDSKRGLLEAVASSATTALDAEADHAQRELLTLVLVQIALTGISLSTASPGLPTQVQQLYLRVALHPATRQGPDREATRFLRQTDGLAGLSDE
jgi:AcrR family transcriptional regulator